MKENISKSIGNSTRIIYGGSVKVGNTQELIENVDIDGWEKGERSFLFYSALIIGFWLGGHL